MKSLIKVILILGLISGSSFILVQLTGLITVERIDYWFNEIRSVSPYYIGVLVLALMFLDLFISIPTLATIMLAGFFMGTFLASVFTITGLSIAGIVGYTLGYKFGDPILDFLLKNENEKDELVKAFSENGFLTILLSRALPVLPEVSTCIAGMTKMPFLKFLTAWLISITPYTVIAAYAGASSSPKSPEPAIIAWALLTSFLWICWFFFKRMRKRAT